MARAVLLFSTLLISLSLTGGAYAAPPLWPLACDGTSYYNSTRCPATQTCAPNLFSVSRLGCCPTANAVACPGGYQCCPSGSKCVPARGSGYGAVFTCTGGAGADTTSTCACKPGPPLPPSKTLKNVLIIGDSLSIGYTPYVAAALADVALVQHAPWDVSDGGAEETAYLLQCLDNWLASPSGVPFPADVIWFNSGMHNLEAPGTLPTPGQAGASDVYGAQLQAATDRLAAAAARMGAKLLYGLTTPFLCSAATDGVITGVLNVNASRTMAAAGIPVVDLHTPIVDKCGAAPTPACFGLAGCFCPHCPPGYSWLTTTVIAPAIRALL
jgi:hypothetical protein